MSGRSNGHGGIRGSLAPATLRLCVGEQGGRLDAERVCDRDEVREADVPLAALDPTDICAMQVTVGCELRLRKVRGGAQLPDGAAERHMVG